jgi:mannosyltransferase
MRRTIIAVILITLLAFMLRINLLGHQELRGDEGFSWNYIQGTPATILERIVREGDPQPPLHYWLLWGWSRLNGDSEFALRFPSVFLSTLLVPLMYQVGRKLWRKEVGLWAAFITALQPQQIWLAQDVRSMYVLALVGLLGTLWFLPSLLRLGGRKNWLGYVLCGLLALYSHYYAIFALLAQGAYVLETKPTTRHALRWLSASIAIALLIVPWAVAVLPVYAGGQLAEPGNLPLTDYTSRVFGEVFAGPAFPMATRPILAAAFGVVALAGLLSRIPWRLYLLAGVLVPFIGIYAIVGLRSIFNAYYFVFAFPALYFLLANGLLSIGQRARWLSIGLLIALIVAYAAGLSNYYFDARYSRTRGLRAAVEYITRHAQPGDTFLANFPDPVQGYYLRQIDLPYNMLPLQPNFDPTDVNPALDRLELQRVWFIPVRANQWDRNGYVESRLNASALLLDNQSFAQTRLLLFAPPDRATPLNAQFAEGIKLIGYALAAPRLTLIWQATSAPSHDYTVFVHALAADGSLVAQHDAPPAPPTSTWRPGEIILDVHEFAIPANQPLTLTAGMYRPDTGERLPISASAPEPNAIVITTLHP